VALLSGYQRKKSGLLLEDNVVLQEMVEHKFVGVVLQRHVTDGRDFILNIMEATLPSIQRP
jgi:hypothetical protein